MGNFNRFHHPINTLWVYSKNEQVFTQNGKKDWSVVPFRWVSIPYINR